MKRTVLLALILALSLTTSGCGQKSTITPLFKAVSVSEQQGRTDGLSVFQASYKVNNNVDSASQVRLPIGSALNGLFNSLSNGLFNLILSMMKSRDVEMDPIEFEIPQDSIDYDLVRELSLTQIKFDVDESAITQGTDFKFIDKIQVFVPDENERDLSRQELEERGDTLLAEYHYKDRDFTCQERKCIQFKIKNVNLMKMIKDRRKLIVKSYIVVRKVPKKEFKLKGSISVEVKLKLPF